LTADEVAAMEREKKGDQNGDGVVQQEVREIEKPTNTTRTPNKGSHPRGIGGGNTPQSGGSMKRKAGQAGLGTASPLKKSKAGNGRVLPMSSGSEDDI
jgi:nuclear transcription factor Y alpha